MSDVGPPPAFSTASPCWMNPLQARSLPASDRDTRTFARLRPDVELVDQALRPAETEPHAVPAGVPIGEREAYICDSRAVVLEAEAKPLPVALLQRFQRHG